jgi:hypothetical protein
MIGLHSVAQRQVVKNITTFDDKRLHFGFSLGIPFLDFSVQHYPTMIDNPKFSTETIEGINIEGQSKIRADVASIKPGFTVAIITNLRLTESLDLRFLPGMTFGERRLTYNIPVVYIEKNKEIKSDNYPMQSTLLDFPLLLKYKSRRMNNQRPYLIGGASYRRDISKTDKDEIVKIDANNFSLEAGMGWDMYLQFFRLSTELKFSFGMNNILVNSVNDDVKNKTYTNALSGIKSDIFILSFHFE